VLSGADPRSGKDDSSGMRSRICSQFGTSRKRRSGSKAAAAAVLTMDSVANLLSTATLVHRLSLSMMVESRSMVATCSQHNDLSLLHRFLVDLRQAWLWVALLGDITDLGLCSCFCACSTLDSS
jgi:hypothetical protein